LQSAMEDGKQCQDFGSHNDYQSCKIKHREVNGVMTVCQGLS
jgi:hypothetical protein